MKQYIYSDQIKKEISPRGLKRLKLLLGFEATDEKIWKDQNIPVFSVGQMFEFLDNHPLSITLPVIEKETTSTSGKYLWKYSAGKGVNSDPSFVDSELCDVLWKAVKKSLNI